MWYWIVAASFLVYINIEIWERVVGGFKFRLVIYVKYLAFSFFIYNLLLIGLSYSDLISSYSLWLNRTIAVVMIPSALVVVMSFINVKSIFAPPEGQALIAKGYGLIEETIASVHREGRRTKMLVQEIHNS